MAGVSELQDVSLGGGEGLQLLGSHHIPSQVRHLGLDLPLALDNRVTPLLLLVFNKHQPPLLHRLAVLLKVELQRFHVVVEAES